MRENEEKKKIAKEVEGNRRQKSEEKKVRENEDKLRGLESCEALVRSVLTFGMDHINNLKVKEVQVILRYPFGLERLKGVPNKVELVEAVTDLFRRDWEDLMQRDFCNLVAKTFFQLEESVPVYMLTEYHNINSFGNGLKDNTAINFSVAAKKEWENLPTNQ